MASNDVQLIIEEKLGELPATLICAFLELVLIVLLFLDGLISFAANEFAHFFGLKIPCLLCTRIDHVLLRRDHDFFYKESICNTHRKEISSLGYCHLHMNLSDVHHMCADCLLSFATEKKSSTAETYRSLVAILGSKLEISVERDHKIHLKLPLNEEEDQSDVKKRNVHRCSCCGAQLRTWTSPDESQLPEIHVPSFPFDTQTLTVKRKGLRCSYPSSHYSFSEQRIASDAESDVIMEDNVSLLSDIDCDMDEVIGKRKFSDSLYGFISEEHHGAQERSIWPGMYVKDGGLKHGLEELTWDNDGSPPHLSERSLLASEYNGKEAVVGATRMLNRCNSDIGEAECIELNEAYKSSMANKLCKTNETTSIDASKPPLPPNPIGLPIVRKRLSIAIEKALDSSSKGNNMTRENWKVLLQHLQRQVHLGRKSLIALSTELDQERNASAVAANQAMAMITRLQEEKAAVVMEALHYRRLMEEQVEYNQDALHVMRDLLIRREKKIKDLEAELDTYKERFQIEEERYCESEDDSYVEMGCNDTEDYKVLSDTIDSS